MLKVFFIVVFVLKSTNLEVGIVNGNEVPIEDRPFQVSLNSNYWPYIYAFHECGGVIISNKFVLTAAHCIDKNETFVVRAGTEISTRWGTVYHVKNTIIHPKYVPYNKVDNPKNDMALLEVSTEIQFTNKIQPIQMAEEGFPKYNNLIVTASGYGQTCFNCSVSGTLLQVVLATILFDECNKMTRIELNNTICAIDLPSKASTSKSIDILLDDLLE